MPPRVAAREEGGGGGLTVGWVLAIAIAGGALLFVSLAFILVTLTDRRNQRARLATESEARLQQDDDVSTETETQTKDGSFRPPRQRRRLTKSPQVSPRKTARRSLPHILPAIKHSGSLNIFGSPAGRKRKNSCNSWIDEDAIHGPKVVKAKRESKGFSLRESWLIMRTPTLPNLLGYQRSNSRAGRAGRQNYLSMGTPSPKSRNGIRSNRNSVKGRPASVAPKMDSLEEKENGESTMPVLTRGGLKGSLRTAESPKRRLSVRFAEVKEPIFVDALEMPEADVEEVSRGRERTRTPTRNRASADSLGLYDKDGFLMSSPERFPSSVAEGRQGGALRI
ncbi:hypothetical protein BN1708_016433, partial [Verticillium longisporum]